MAQSSREGDPDKIIPIRSAPLLVLLSPSPKESFERHGPTHSKISLARGKIQLQKFPPKELGYNILTPKKWGPGNQRSQSGKYSNGRQAYLEDSVGKKGMVENGYNKKI